MAFSKARIMRFNDITTCAPPPGAYNPKYDENVPGAIKYTKDNKPEPQSPASSMSDVRSINSTLSVASFRTPTIPRRKKVTMPNSAGKKKVSFFSPPKSEALREKIVECVNKDETIKELESQLEDFKLAISTLNIQKDYIVKERDETLEKIREVQIQIENLNKELMQKDLITDNFHKMKSELKAQNVAEMKQLQDNLDFLQINLDEYKTILRKAEEDLEESKLAYNKLETEHFELLEKHSQLEIKYEELKKRQMQQENVHLSEIEILKRLHQTALTEAESELATAVSNWKKTVEVIEKDNKTKIDELEYKQKSEIEKLKVDMLTGQADLLKNVDELKTDVEKLNTELGETKTKLKEEITQHQKDKSAALAEKHCYEITLNKTYDTVNALKNRLLNSDRDVEQLTRELGNLEKAKFEVEEKYMEENKNLKKENEELKSEKETVFIIKEQVAFLETDFLSKIDKFKIKADSEISRLTIIIEKQANELKKLHSYIQEQRLLHNNAYTLVADARSEIEKLELEANDYKVHILNLETILSEKQKSDDDIHVKDKQIQDLKDKLKERDLEMNELASIYKKYIEKSRLYDELQQQFEELGKKNQRLEKKIVDQNTLIGPFREQLENYERECHMLMLHKDEAEKEAKEMGMKYAEILGHQNYKQKLKHMVDLKRKNFELIECKQNYEVKIMQQSRTIEKLKSKISQSNNKTKTINKENVGSPGRTPNVYSTVALKERN